MLHILIEKDEHAMVLIIKKSLEKQSQNIPKFTSADMRKLKTLKSNLCMSLNAQCLSSIPGTLGSSPSSIPGRLDSSPSSLPGKLGSSPSSIPGRLGSSPSLIPGRLDSRTGQKVLVFFSPPPTMVNSRNGTA